MALINIEYGSVARSEILNKNFLYLDEKIADSNTATATGISSILSNIATINARLNELGESVANYVEDFNSTLDEYKSKTKILVNSASMMPNWNACIAITETTSYTAPSNGYLLLTPKNNSKGALIVNNNTVNFKLRNAADDNSAQMVAIPVKENDVMSSDIEFVYAYFLPVAEVKVEGF